MGVEFLNDFILKGLIIYVYVLIWFIFDENWIIILNYEIKFECKCILLIFGNDRNKKFLEYVLKLSLIYIIYGFFSLLFLVDIFVRLYSLFLYGV